jgi:hypothetical protein
VDKKAEKARIMAKEADENGDAKLKKQALEIADQAKEAKKSCEKKKEKAQEKRNVANKADQKLDAKKKGKGSKKGKYDDLLHKCRKELKAAKDLKNSGKKHKKVTKISESKNEEKKDHKKKGFF